MLSFYSPQLNRSLTWQTLHTPLRERQARKSLEKCFVRTWAHDNRDSSAAVGDRKTRSPGEGAL